MPYTGPDCLKTLTKLKQLERQQDILPLPGLHWHWHCKQHKYLWATNRGQSRPGKEKLLTLILLASFYLEELSTRPESEGSLTTETRPEDEDYIRRRDVKFHESFRMKFIFLSKHGDFSSSKTCLNFKSGKRSLMNIEQYPQTASKWCLKN